MLLRVLKAGIFLVLFVAAVVSPRVVSAQAEVNLPALRGLAPFSVLPNTAAGQAALESNYVVTGAIADGTAKQAALQASALQRDQALEDAFITSGNASELADGLGTQLGTEYQVAAVYTSGDDGATSSFTSVSPQLAALFAYTAGVTGADAAAAKFFFANATVVSHGEAGPLSKDGASILSAAGGVSDVYGRAYHRPAGSKGADPYGNSRPFQTETSFAPFGGLDYFGELSKNADYLEGPAQNLVESPAFPSGHTTYGFTEALLLALFVPQRYPQMIVRGAEYGNSRIVMGAHYAMDVIGGRTLAYYDVAHLLAQDPAYAGGQADGAIGVAGYRAAVIAARSDLTKALLAGCGSSIAQCASVDSGRFSDGAKDAAFYETTQTYGLAAVYDATAHKSEDVAALAPEAGYLLSVAFPGLTLAQADGVLTKTEGPGGGFLDDGSAFGVYSRLDLYKAALMAQSLAGTVHGG
jgi:membrane-associated phospholipid phosphatase